MRLLYFFCYGCPSEGANTERKYVKIVKNCDHFQLDYIAFAEKFAGFAQKLRGVRLRTVDSDELLDFNMAEVGNNKEIIHADMREHMRNLFNPLFGRRYLIE